LVNSVVSSSNLTIDRGIEFSVNPPNHLLSSSCITFKRTRYSLPNHHLSFLVNITSTQKKKNTMLVKIEISPS